ncbi:long-chain fatty acid--CoA ligase [Gulosibacter macacae]|uniref:Acyl-CoA synthetase n=1 Tax=Gulosibacter macacae TaxID=2488791 RepID=A0A3P3VXR7_9MICO|nr:AMP-dependent synthetase/ligase [Gulosibacter macacae]RRJ86259.1 long-chain fatty acid--CoA ligase [Gulosibacter macacae]
MTDSPVLPRQGSVRTEITTPAVVEADPSLNTTDLLRRRVRLSGADALFSVPEGDGWRDISAAEFSADVDRIAKGFIAAGVQPGDRIAFIGQTCYEWSLVDFALWTAGAVMVPVYETSSSEQLKWMLEDSGAKGLLTQSEDHTAKYRDLGDEAPQLQWRWTMHDGALDELRSSGASVSDEALETARTTANADDIATLIYTSGSTGRPKGVVLTHANFVELCRNVEGPLSPLLEKPGASTLLFVTLAHVFARFISVLAVSSGVRVGHQPDTTQLVPSLGSFKPTFLLAVPRVFEKVYNSAGQKAAAGGKGKIFKKAVATGVAYSKAVDAGKVPFGLKLQYKIFDKLVFSKLRETLGGNVEHAVSGSAPLGLFLGHFYKALGVQVLEGYGLTETTAPVSVNLPGAFKIGTVGPPLPGCAVKLGEDGEILTRGVNVFREYWQNPEATAEAFTEDGWFHTGDVGELDADGYLRITGRKKDIIVTAGGKNVAPAMLEDPLRADVIVGEAVVVGDQRPFVAAILTLDAEMLPKWLELHGLDANMSVEEASTNEAVLAHLQGVVDRANARVSRAESIRKFKVLDHVFTIADGTLTPKLSIKRHVVLDRYSAEIDEIYGGPVEKDQ